MKVWIIIPAYNEDKNIGRVVRGLFQHGWRNVVVVDDGSQDETARMARKEGAVVVRHKLNRGQGASLQTGNEFALACGADQIVHFDGDNQFDPADVQKAVDYLNQNKLDVVLGSKMLEKNSNIPFLKKYCIVPVAKVINFILTGVWLSDVHNGFRVLTARACEGISITHSGMAHNSEIILKIKKNKFKFAEIPVNVSYHEFGQNVFGGFKILFDWVIGKSIYK